MYVLVSHLCGLEPNDTLQVEAQRDALSKQLEELFQTRKTEPEQVLGRLQLQYDERAQSMLEPHNLLHPMTGRSTGCSPQGAYFTTSAG